MSHRTLSSTLIGIAALAVLASCHHPPHRPEAVRAPVAPEVAGPVADDPAPEPEPAPEPDPAPDPVVAPAPGPEVRAAIERGLVVLLADGDAWMEGRAPFQDGSGCVSCHQVPYGVWGLEEAARAGVVGDAEAAADLRRRAFEFVDRPRIGRPMSWSPLTLALAADDPELDLFVEDLLSSQRSAGFWEARGQFPEQRRELSETNAVATLMAMLALAAAADGDPAVAASLASAGSWVADRGPGESTEWLLLKALVESEHGDETVAAGHFRDLLDQQNADGGWGWNPGEESNAFSTGEALWALGRGRPAGSEAAVRDGLRYLTESQEGDGWWRVPSALICSASADSKDYVYDYWGTAWATIGLARSLEPVEIAAVR